MDNLLQIIGALGVGGLVSSYLTFLYKRKEEIGRSAQEHKEQRYKCIMMLIHARLNFAKNQQHLNKYGYDISTMDDLDDLLSAESINAYLFASDEFIGTFAAFLSNPGCDTQAAVAVAMRKDLWNIKTKIK